MRHRLVERDGVGTTVYMEQYWDWQLGYQYQLDAREDDPYYNRHSYFRWLGNALDR
jgi:hypothetical protein